MNAEPQAPGTLATIVEEARRRVAALRPRSAELERNCARAQPPPDFVRALAGGTVAIIAEVKRRSPSAGPIRPGAGAVALARAYADGGAAAISVLTEEKHFGGTLQDLADVARAVGLPVLRKDFVIDPLQLFEARAAGAAAVLLIARLLAADQLGSLAALAREIGLATLIEVHRPDELPGALAAAPAMLGINARDLDTLAVDPARVQELLPRVPPGVVAVAESGVSGRQDVERVASAGADAVLVGSAVAGAADPGAALRSLGGVVRTRGTRR